MNYWTILFIIITIAMFVGPVAILKPSQEEQRLNQLRQAAAKKNINVSLTSLQWATEKKQLAIYSIPLFFKLESKLQSTHAEWCLLRQSFEHELHFSKQWDWANKQKTAPDKQHTFIRKQLAHLHPSIFGIELTRNSICLYWTEQELALDILEAMLINYRDKLSA